MKRPVVLPEVISVAKLRYTESCLANYSLYVAVHFNYHLPAVIRAKIETEKDHLNGRSPNKYI